MLVMATLQHLKFDGTQIDLSKLSLLKVYQKGREGGLSIYISSKGGLLTVFKKRIYTPTRD